MTIRARVLTATLGLLLASASPGAQRGGTAQPTTVAERQASWARHQALARGSVFAPLPWRAIGPAFQGGRVEALALARPGSDTIYLGAGSGSLWKTDNAGTTWAPVFEHESTFTIGDVAVAPSAPDVVWVGTGEVLMARSSFAGTGVYKSTDAGRTWRHMGLADTHHIGKVVIDPRDPDTVYVAAIGHLFSDNEERGLFKTTDGGTTWQKILYVNERTGAIDLVMDPRDRRTLFAVAWEHDRRAWNHTAAGPGSGVYRTRDGGRTWTRLAGGLPVGDHLGRVGLAIAPSRPDVMYAIVDNRTPLPPEPGARAGAGVRVVGGELYRSDDRGATWRKTHDGPLGTAIGYDFCIVEVSPDNPDEVYVLGNNLRRSRDGGRTFETVGGTIVHVRPHGGTALHLDHHELVIDPADPDHLLLGNDGGLYVSRDRGASWLHVNTLPIGEFYAVSLDMADPYRVFGGTQDDAAVYGTAAPFDQSVDGDWRHVYLDRWAGGDSYFTLVDPIDPDLVYFEHQFGALRRKNLATGETAAIQPRAAVGEPPLRYNWMTPFVISRHNPFTLYYGANRVLKSVDRGDHWTPMSPDLTTDPGPGQQGNVPYGTITSISESPFAAGELLVGTDDGRVHYTKDDGRTWTDVTAGLPDTWVSRVVWSAHDASTFYASLTGYRQDDFRTYLFRSTDLGRTWQSIAGNLPDEPVNVVREDPKSARVLYVGTDLGAFVSLDGGVSWQGLGANLPTAAVHDIAIHPRDDEVVVATHGLSLFAIDARPIQAMTEAVRSSDLHVFEVRPAALRRHPRDNEPAVQGPAGVAVIHYHLKAPGPVVLTIRDDTGVVRTIEATGAAGVNAIAWDLTAERPAPSGDGTVRRDAPAGAYVVEIAAAGRRMERPLRVEPFEPR